MRVLVIGDIHGNIEFLRRYIYPTAVCLDVQLIVQVGDFGYWEHTKAGVDFLDQVDDLARETAIAMYWLHGNHDKHSLTLKKYGHSRDKQGFIQVRPWVNYIPQGHVWEWEGRRMRAFGGAYSIDKQYRLSQEQKAFRRLQAQAEGRKKAGIASKPVPSQAGTLWFPEEEMSDGDMAKLLKADSREMHYVFSHDKPRSSNPQWNRKDLLECWPNQDRLQRALLAHRPLHWFHGHLHHRYVDTVRTGDGATVVVGLDCDDQAAESFWRPWFTYAVIEMREDGTDRVLLGGSPELDVDSTKLGEVADGLATAA